MKCFLMIFDALVISFLTKGHTLPDRRRRDLKGNNVCVGAMVNLMTAVRFQDFFLWVFFVVVQNENNVLRTINKTRKHA